MLCDHLGQCLFCFDLVECSPQFVLRPEEPIQGQSARASGGGQPLLQPRARAEGLRYHAGGR